MNFGRGRRTLLQSFMKEKDPNYYQKTRRELGYVSTPIASNFKSKEFLYHDHTSGTPSWELNVSVGI